MRERLGPVLQVAGLALMPVALWIGMSDEGATGTELALFALGLALVFVGRGLRSGRPPT